MSEYSQIAARLLAEARGTRPLVVAGPCSAESEAQTEESARMLASGPTAIFRAGAWKPRTRPGGFQGHGAVALQWIADAAHAVGVPAATEVALPEHATAAAEAGIDVFWIGARTASDPFALDALASELARMPEIPVLLKNPLAPDLELWLGGIERLRKAGVRTIAAVHRGFSQYGEKRLRNAPVWSVPIELRRRVPDVTLLHDPSHTSGRADLVGELSQQAMDLGFDGLMIESHPTPQCALSDAAQQITPEALRNIVATLVIRRGDPGATELCGLRARIDALDSDLLALLAERMKVCREIGGLKAKLGMSVVQSERYAGMMESMLSRADSLGIGREALQQILEAIHQESVRQQLSLLR